MRQAAIDKLRAWAARRHGRDALPITISRRRIYILPTRVGLMLALMLVAMLIAALNYNSNLGLAFAFLMTSVALVTMHHCNRNLLGLRVDAAAETDAFAGGEARFEFALRNDSKVDRRDVEVRCMASGAICSVAARSNEAVSVAVPVARRGVVRVSQFELRTRIVDRLRRARRARRADLARGRRYRLGLALGIARRRGFLRPAQLRARRAAQTHGMEGPGAGR
jgi:hypothetical protein